MRPARSWHAAIWCLSAATTDAPSRFAKSRAVGAYLGLTTRRFQSGEMDYSGRISKMGDAMVRSRLYEAANSMLTVVRKLAVILHGMLTTGELFRWPEMPEKKAAATA